MRTLQIVEDIPDFFKEAGIDQITIVLIWDRPRYVEFAARIGTAGPDGVKGSVFESKWMWSYDRYQRSLAVGRIITQSQYDELFLAESQQCDQFTVLVQQADVKNSNGRIYPLSELQKLVGHRDVYGEYGQPSGQPLERCMTIDPSNVSHVASNLHMVGSSLMCDISPRGPQASKMLEVLGPDLDRASYALRGLADIALDGTVSNYRLIGIDVVSERA